MEREDQGGITEWPMGRLLSTAARLVEREWNDVLARNGLTHAGLLTLHALEDGPHTQRELASLSYVEEQTMSRVLDRLERTGYVTRERDSRDRRRLVVRATREGARAYRTAARGGMADRLVSDRVADPERFRLELVRLVERLHPPGPSGSTGQDRPREGAADGAHGRAAGESPHASGEAQHAPGETPDATG